MLRTAFKSFVLMTFFLGGLAGVLFWYDHFSASRQIQKLEDEKRQLQQIVQGLGAEERVADVLVFGQTIVDGVPHTTLLCVEYDKKGQPLPARTFTIEGKQAHFDALVIKFDRGFVEQDDPLRGHSIRSEEHTSELQSH